MSYGEKITFLRKRSGMTQTELGEKLNITYQAVSKWERDESDPDFSTMSKIARIFNVPLSFFEDEADSEEAAGTNTASELDAETLRQILEEHDTALRERAERERIEREQEERKRLEEQLAWEESVRAERERAERERLEKERQWAENARLAKIEEERQEEQRKKQRHLKMEKDAIIKRRNRGLIAATIITLTLLAITLVTTIVKSYSTVGIALLSGALILFAFPFIAQLFWDGFIVDVIFTGFQVVGTPGVIFSFSLEGFIFLIVMKILFAILRIILMVLIFLFFLCLAILISPFSFIPQVIKLSLGKDL